MKLKAYEVEFVSEEIRGKIGLYSEQLRPYWQSIRSLFSRIDKYSNEGEPAYWKSISAFGRGINPLTGLTVHLKSRGKKQVVAFYCEEQNNYWVSTNSGHTWVILPDSEAFLKVIDKVDVII